MAAYAIASVKKKIDHLFDSQSNIQYQLPTRDIQFFYHDLMNLELVISQHRSKKVRSVVLEQQIEDVVDKFEDLIGSHFSSFDEFLNTILEITTLKEKLKKGEYEIEVDHPPQNFLSPDDELLFGRYDSIMDHSHLVELDHDAQVLKRPFEGAPVTLFLCGNGDAIPGHYEGELFKTKGGKVYAIIGEIQHLMFLVLYGSLNLKVIVVWGMAGCGKTTLVKLVFSEVNDLFNVKLMISIALNGTLKQILVGLLTGLGFIFGDGTIEMLGEFELGMFLRNRLKGRRYLIVLDNLWDSSAWYELKKFFPNDCNRSRIICTCREEELVQESADILINHHRKTLMRDDASWRFLQDLTFTTKEFLNPQLEEIGQEIAKKCEGLPLAIVSMAKLLREAEKTTEKWEQILKDDDPFQIKRNNGQPISRSLYLSYDRLPYHLKFCFLYTGVFPKHHEIKCSQLVMLWIAEGLVTPKDGASIEDTAMGYIRELQHKHMILPTYKVHFVFRCLCIREAQEEKFCLVMKKYVQACPPGTNIPQRLCIHNNAMLGIKEVHNFLNSISGVYSLLCCGPWHKYPLRVFLNFKLLKILHALNVRFYEFPIEVLELIRLKYLAITYDGELPNSISKLWKLEFLILSRYHIIRSSQGPSYLPPGIWKLKWLKHLWCTGLDLLDPNCTNGILNFLSTLCGVSAQSCTPQILGRLHNLNKLKVLLHLRDDEVGSFSFFSDVAQNLHCLDSLKCVVVQVFRSHVLPPKPVFPLTISKLTLSGCGFPWKYMSAISVLPYLIKLKLTDYAFCGPVWEACDGGFGRLECLIMKDLNIEEWKAKAQHFPALVQLRIHHCYNLHEIPTEFGILKNLRTIMLCSNKLSVEKSARQIQEMKQTLFDDDFKLRVSLLGSDDYYLLNPKNTTSYSTMLDHDHRGI